MIAVRVKYRERGTHVSVGVYLGQDKTQQTLVGQMQVPEALWPDAIRWFAGDPEADVVVELERVP